jgi:hypothetical protein
VIKGMGKHPDRRRLKRQARHRNERHTIQQLRQHASLLKPILRELGADLPFYDLLDSYETEFNDLASEGKERFRSLSGIHEVDGRTFEDTDWSLFGLKPADHLQFTFDEQFAGYGSKGADTANIRGVAAFFRQADGGFRSIILIPRTPRTDIQHPDLKYALKIAALTHELGHICDAENGLHIDPITGRFDLIEAEAYANCYALDLMAHRALRQSYAMLHDAIAGKVDASGYEGEIARRVMHEHGTRDIPDWQEHLEEALSILSA